MDFIFNYWGRLFWIAQFFCSEVAFSEIFTSKIKPKKANILKKTFIDFNSTFLSGIMKQSWWSSKDWNSWYCGKGFEPLPPRLGFPSWWRARWWWPGLWARATSWRRRRHRPDSCPWPRATRWWRRARRRSRSERRASSAGKRRCSRRRRRRRTPREMVAPGWSSRTAGTSRGLDHDHEASRNGERAWVL